MPAINVAKSDTFEIQRQKINQIGTSLFNITQGGSDLSTDILKLGDGSLNEPSFAFTSDSTVGVYKPSLKTLGIVSSGKSIIDFSDFGSQSLSNFNLVRKSILQSSSQITNFGSGYDPGTYTNVLFTGGSGNTGESTITVEAFSGSVTTIGFGYQAGNYSNITVIGGSGGNSTADIVVDGLTGAITNSGSGYITGDYPNVPLVTQTGVGTNAEANIAVGYDGNITVVTITTSGSGYLPGDILTVANADVGGTGSGFQYTVTSTVGRLSSLNFVNKASRNEIGDVLTISNGATLSISITQDVNTFTVPAIQINNIQVGQIVSASSGITFGTTVTDVNALTNTVTISTPATETATRNLTFTPVYGIATTPIQFTISALGSVSNVEVSKKGYGYSVGDILSVNSEDLREVKDYSVTLVSVEKLSFVTTPTGITTATEFELLLGRVNTVTVTSSTTIAGQANQTYTNVASTTNGDGIDAIFTIKRDATGNISEITISRSGSGYLANDTITISGTSIGGSSPTDDLVLNVVSVGQSVQNIPVYKVVSSSGSIINVYIQSSSTLPGDTIQIQGSSTQFIVSSVVTGNKYFIDTESGPTMTPDLTLYVGDKYTFSYSESTYNTCAFKLSAFKDGTHAPSKVENITTTLSVGSNQITVSDVTGIINDMLVTVTTGTGTLSTNTRVTNVSGNTITLSSNPTADGFVSLTFAGYAYTPGVTVSSTQLTISVLPSTPSTLYYFCESFINVGGDDNLEGIITVNPVNPNPFGSGFQYTLNDIDTNTVIQNNAADGKITALNVEFDDATLTNADIQTLLSTSITSNLITTNQISSTTLNLTSTDFKIESNVQVVNTSLTNTIQIFKETGNIETIGELKSTTSINSNDVLKITDNNIKTFSNNDLLLSPFNTRVVKIDTSTALILPSGTTSERPAVGLLENGAVRFNTDTSQYEGYNSSTLSWSSLGGVRDLDNNTYIVAESSVGANDNVLYFYNDDINTYRFGGEYQTFYNSKKIRSLNTSAPLYTNWNTNTPVSAGQYLKYRNDVYLVVNGGTTGTSGNEPNDTSGNTFLNGSATLQYNTSAVAPLTFEEISEVRIAPLGGTSLVVNGDLKLFNNQITTITNDILLTPSVNKKVKVNTTTSLVIPVGSDSEKGSPEIGSIRYNTTINQFEGYNSSLNWTSLGGVRDVDGNTYIVPETAPGANENTLYFYNNNSNTLRVTENQVEFDIIDTIASPTSDLLNINVSLITLDSLATSIDNSDSSRTFISSTKENFDFGISTGLVNDTVLRITDVGDFYYNIGFGSGTLNAIKVFDKDLKSFELSNFKVVTESNTLVKGTSDSGNTIIYNPALSVSAKVQIVAYNLTTGDKEFFEYSVIDTVNDVFYTEYGNIKTGSELITAQFSIVQTGVRLTYTLNPSTSAGNNVLIKIVSQIIKR